MRRLPPQKDWLIDKQPDYPERPRKINTNPNGRYGLSDELKAETAGVIVISDDDDDVTIVSSTGRYGLSPELRRETIQQRFDPPVVRATPNPPTVVPARVIPEPPTYFDDVPLVPPEPVTELRDDIHATVEVMLVSVIDWMRTVMVPMIIMFANGQFNRIMEARTGFTWRDVMNVLLVILKYACYGVSVWAAVEMIRWLCNRAASLEDFRMILESLHSDLDALRPPPVSDEQVLSAVINATDYSRPLVGGVRVGPGAHENQYNVCMRFAKDMVKSVMKEELKKIAHRVCTITKGEAENVARALGITTERVTQLLGSLHFGRDDAHAFLKSAVQAAGFRV